MPRTILALALVPFTFLPATVTQAQIVGTLEGPGVLGAQVSNVQGWVYTKTPGAELIQPFQVRIDGEDAFKVPCCSDRGDVKGAHPDAPLATGFAGVYNWALQGGGGEEVLVEVVVKDTAGGQKVLSKTVKLYALHAEKPFVSFLFSQGAGFGGPPLRRGYCDISDEDPMTAGPAELRCRNLLHTRFEPPDSISFFPCPAVSYAWDSGTQGFLQTSDCESRPRWTDDGDGTATDGWSGLVWEIKTDDGGLHDVDDTYDFSTGDPWKADGAIFTDFLALLNTNTSDTGTSPDGCFAGRCDWRLPTSKELREISPLHPACETLPDCGSIPGETAAAPYWSSTTASSPAFAWLVDFEDGGLLSAVKSGASRVRAVSGGR